MQLRFDKRSYASLALQMAPTTTAVVAFPNIEQLEVLVAPIFSRCVHPFMSFDQRLLLSVIFAIAILFLAVLFIFLNKFSQAFIISNAPNVFKRSHALHLHYQNQ